jgi:hypothetical protein
VIGKVEKEDSAILLGMIKNYWFNGRRFSA